MLIVGLTGGIATGKSTVSSIFKSLGCPVIDADEIAREVVKPNQKAWKAIKRHFGNEVFDVSGELNREKLSQIIFTDPAKRKVLNDCTHPYIFRTILWELVSACVRGEQFVILDIPLLYETGAILSVTNQAQQRKRLIERSNLTEDEAEQRIEAQLPLEEKCRRATYIIDNSGTKEETNKQVNNLYLELRSSYGYLRLRNPNSLGGGATPHMLF
ncbi:predicted protein [Nematostella vectensis]|uniref:Dephospho-CoA kinase domain-containing protein n=1 Tax=Nematostella vectensis TaxID=45351 RepID=A7S224_NEMVE|nr:predicted protein [Nematostella vectensis]|eukprot:XP_001634226.1 predicted protein [Nematostella vectensis]